MTNNTEGLIKIKDAGKLIGRTMLTIKHWYKWAETPVGQLCPVKLPEVIRIGSRGDMYFTEEGITGLKVFRDYLALHPGLMRAYNWKRQGEVGKLHQERYEFKNLLDI